MNDSRELDEFVVLTPSAHSPQQHAGPSIDLQHLHISSQRFQSSPRISGHGTDLQEPSSNGGHSSSGGGASSATISETKKMGKFRFLTIPNQSNDCPSNSEGHLGGSPYLHEPSSAESCEEPTAIRKPLPFPVDVPPIYFSPTTSSRVSSSSADASTVAPTPTATSTGPDRPRDHDEDVINKHVKRLLKVTEISDNIAEAEEDFSEEDDDFDSRLDQMIAEEEQSRKKGRKRTGSKSVMARRRSTRNSRKDDVKEEPKEPLISVPPVLPDDVAEEPVVVAAAVPEPKKRGRKKKVSEPAQPPSESNVSEVNEVNEVNEMNEVNEANEPSEQDVSVTGKDASDDAASQMSEVKADSEDLSDARPGKLKSRWVEQAERFVPADDVVVEDVKREEKEVVEETPLPLVVDVQAEPSPPTSATVESHEGTYQHITDCIRISRHKMRDDREARKMRCDCQYTQEEADYGMKGCMEGCINRLLYIECGPKCPAKENCSNKRFQRREYAAVEIFKTKLKGHGIRAKQPLAAGQFICEYVGEVLDARQFKKRQKEYHNDNIQHHYFMALNSDEVIDATRKGNATRFTNHSCDPNSETQKWTVGGQLRIGFFTLRPIAAGEEITFDYQFERYGKKAQRCYCASSQCRGFIGSVSGDERKKATKGEISDRKMVSEIDKFVQLGALRTADQALKMARLLLRVESDTDRLILLRVLQNSEENVEALRSFLRCQGLTILADLMYVCRNSSSEMKLEILSTLQILPVTSRNGLVESKVWETLERWAGVTVTKENPVPSAPITAPPVPEAAVDAVKVDKVEGATLTESVSVEKTPHMEGEAEVKVESTGTPPIQESIEGEHQVLPSGNLKAEDGNGNAVKGEVDEDSQDAMEEASPKTDLTDNEMVKKVARDLLRHFTDNVKLVFRIPKKLMQAGEPTSAEDSRKSPVKAIPSGSGTIIPTLSSNWGRGRRSPSPLNDLMFRQKQPRLLRPPFLRPDRPFFFPRRPVNPSFPHPPFLRHPHFPHMIPMETDGGYHVQDVGHEQLAAAAYDAALNTAAMALEQARVNSETAAELVSKCLLNNTVSATRHVSLHLGNNEVHDVRTFKPTTAQIEQLKSEVPVMGSADWESKAAMIRERTMLEVKALDAPVTKEVVGWMANFDLSKHLFLPKDWCAAYDRVGRLYFYNVSNGVSRWDFPTEDHVYSTVLHPLSSTLSIPADLKDYTTVSAASVDMRPWSPQGDDEDSPRENTVPKKLASGSSRRTLATGSPRRTLGSGSSRPRTKAERQMKSEKSQAALKKRKIEFQNDVCQYVLQVLNAYRLPNCTQGRIETKEDFKYLARKFTHNVLEQEIKRHRETPDALKFSSKHKPKIKEHVKKYMSRFGRVYKPIGGGEARTKEEENRKNLVDVDEDEEEDDEVEDDEGDSARGRDGEGDSTALVTEKGEVQIEGDVDEDPVTDKTPDPASTVTQEEPHSSTSPSGRDEAMEVG